MRLSEDIRVRLEPSVADALRVRAKIERRSVANLTRCAVEDYLKDASISQIEEIGGGDNIGFLLAAEDVTPRRDRQ